MDVEDPQKLATEKTPNPNTEDDLEEGEIVAGGDDDSSLKKSVSLPYQPHPLEHQWTFWFDNPSAKSKQASWGSSLRSIFTFSTIEEFWRLRLFSFVWFLIFLPCSLDLWWEIAFVFS